MVCIGHALSLNTLTVGIGHYMYMSTLTCYSCSHNYSTEEACRCEAVVRVLQPSVPLPAQGQWGCSEESADECGEVSEQLSLCVSWPSHLLHVSEWTCTVCHTALSSEM